MTRRHRRLLGSAVVAGAILLLSWLRLRAERPLPPDVFLVTVDTLRADSLGCYGHAGAETPFFDRIAREGVLFENAVAPMPITRPSHFSLMTSQPPHEHGVLNNSMPLPESALTLAEAFKEAGYYTVGSVAVRLLGPDSGAAQGFDVFDAPTEPPRWPGSEALERLAAQVRNRPTGRSLFAWLHLFEPHIPYVSHRTPMLEPAEISWPLLLAVAARNRGEIPFAVFDRARQLYQEEVAEADRILGGVLQILDRSGTPAVLAVVADHGECFENGVFFEHANCLYEGAIRVPLLIRFPTHLAPRRTQDPVELRLVGPALLQLAGLRRPPTFEQASVFSEGKTPIFFQSPVYAKPAAQTTVALSARYQQIRRVAGQEVRPFEPFVPQFGVRWKSWKYIVAGSREELFDMARDPRETTSVASSHPVAVEEMKHLLREWSSRHPPGPREVTVVDPELQKSLRSLGYLQ
jgi:arylsulfatase A-like enzyme